VPEDSRAGGGSVFLSKADITASRIAKVKRLVEVAAERGQSLAQLALAFVLRQRAVASVIIGASRLSQIEDCLGVIAGSNLSSAEMDNIEGILAD
jgi:L-glyceraldehyde 3-phosphate reductase